jgi:hypothetical protein
LRAGRAHWKRDIAAILTNSGSNPAALPTEREVTPEAIKKKLQPGTLDCYFHSLSEVQRMNFLFYFATKQSKQLMINAAFMQRSVMTTHLVNV